MRRTPDDIQAEIDVIVNRAIAAGRPLTRKEADGIATLAAEKVESARRHRRELKRRAKRLAAGGVWHE